MLTCGGLYLMDPGLAVSYSLGTVLVAVSFGFQRKLRCPIRDVSSLCMGVYLIHGAVMSGFKIIPWVTQHYLMWFVMTILVSFLGVAFVRRMPYLKIIV